jgi:hypothetical protein
MGHALAVLVIAEAIVPKGPRRAKRDAEPARIDATPPVGLFARKIRRGSPLRVPGPESGRVVAEL